MKIIFLLSVCVAISFASLPNLHIYFGKIVPNGQAPYQAALVNKDGEFVCAATIIHPYWILTAAHCAPWMSSKLKVRYNTLFRTFKGEFADINCIIVHPKFNQFTYENDIAVIGVHGLNLTLENAKAIRLADPDFDPVPRSKVRVTGWGQANFQGDLSEHLMEISIPVIDRKHCQRCYESDIRSVDEGKFCAGDIVVGGRNAGVGDDGGPAIQNGKLVGIFSSGRENSLKNSPGIYIRIGKYVDFIREAMKSTCLYQ